MHLNVHWLVIPLNSCTLGLIVTYNTSQKRSKQVFITYTTAPNLKPPEKQVAGRYVQIIATTTTVALIWFQLREAVVLLCHSLKRCCWIRCTGASSQGTSEREFFSLSLAAVQPPAGVAAATVGSVAGGELCLQWPVRNPNAKPRDCLGATRLLSFGLGICKVRWGSAMPAPLPRLLVMLAEGGTRCSILVLLCLN